MPRMINHLKFTRLLAMQPAEVVYRLRLELAARFEKGFKRKKYLKRESVDDFLVRHLREFHKKERENIALQVFNRFCARRYFAWQADVPTLLKLFDNEFLDDKMRTILHARDLLALRFKIFNKSWKFDREIDWHFDVFGEKSLPVIYSKDLDYWNPDIVRDVKYVWELNRHQHFVTLAKAFLLTGNEKYAQALFAQWEHWIEKNPFKHGINWTSSLEAAFRLFSWTWALQMVKNSRHFTPLLYLRILQSIEQHAVFISGKLSLYSSANNHLLGEALGLFYAGCYYPELQQAPRWQSTGYQLLCREIPVQVYKDGVIKEQTVHYQQYILYFGLLFKFAADYVNKEIPKTVLDRLEKMAFFLGALMDSKGNLPDIGDQDGGCTLRLDEMENNLNRDILNAAAIFFKQGGIKRVPFGQGALWLCGVSGYHAYEDLQKQGPKVLQKFPFGGYAVVNNSVQKMPQTLCFDAGPLGLGRLAAHGHADALSVWWFINGEPVLLDAGTYMYLGAVEWRRYFRGTGAHNTLRVDGQDQSEMQGPFQWGRKANAELLECTGDPTIVLRGRHDGYANLGVIHERVLAFRGNEWTIKDILHGRGRHRVELFFHLGQCSIRSAGEKIVCRFQKFQVQFHFSPGEMTFSIENGSLMPKSGWRSTKFGEKHPSPVIHTVAEQLCPAELITTMKVEP